MLGDFNSLSAYLPWGQFSLAVAAALAVVLASLVTRPRTYYFIRHGRTKLNDAHIKQGPGGGLAENGKTQAIELAKTLAKAHIARIYTSPYERALETADIIHSYIHCPVTVVPLLAERRNATEVVGKRTDDPEVKRIVALTDLSFHDDAYRYSDEENFADLKLRAKRCLGYLTRRPHQNMCVVTHHAFLHMLLSTMLLGKKLDATNYVKLSFFNPAENGGVTVCVYHPWRIFAGGNAWEIRSYNE